jgi:hypothetical protein
LAEKKFELVYGAATVDSWFVLPLRILSCSSNCSFRFLIGFTYLSISVNNILVRMNSRGFLQLSIHPVCFFVVEGLEGEYVYKDGKPDKNCNVMLKYI